MISIIVPVYNAENYIEDCVNSILHQSFSDWELLLIDNGSEDNSLELCKKLANEEKRICVLHQEANGGVSAARNLGMARAKGNWITFIDADDWVEHDFLERLLAMQKESQADMVICGYRKRYAEDRKIYHEAYPKGLSVDQQRECTKDGFSIAGEEYGRKAYLENCLLAGNTHCWGALYKKGLVQEIEFPVGLSIGEDLLFLIDAALKAQKIIVTDYPGYSYYINTRGAMEKPFTLSYMDQITCWQKAAKKLEEVYPELGDRLQSLLLVAVLLVVGKLARLSREERKQYRRQQEYCLRLARECVRNREVFSYLPKGYPLKVRVYCILPQVYLWAYGRWRQGK